MASIPAGATVLDRFVTEYLFKGDYAALNRIESRVARVRKGLDKFAGKATIFGIGAIANLAGVALAGVKTSHAINDLRASVELTADEVERFKNRAYELGSQLPLNTADIIDAMKAYIKLGNSADEAYEAIAAIAYTATATKNPIEEVARYASVGLNTFQKEASYTVTLLDQMARMEDASAASFRDIGEALKFSSQAASDLGLETHQYIGLLGAVSAAGRSASEVSQSLNQMFQRLARAKIGGIGRGAAILKRGMGALDVDVDELLEAFEDGQMIGVFKLINKAWIAKGRDNMRLTAALSSLAGANAPSLSYAVQNIEEIERITAEAFNSVGESAYDASIMMSGLGGSLDSIKAQIDTLTNILSDAGIGGAVSGFLFKLSAMVAWLAETDAEGNRLHGTLLRVTAVIMVASTGVLVLAIAAKALSFVLGGLGMIWSVVNGIAKWHWVQTVLNTISTKGFAGALMLGKASLLKYAGGLSIAAFGAKLFTLATWLSVVAVKALKVAIYSTPLIGWILFAISLLIMLAPWLWNLVKKLLGAGDAAGVLKEILATAFGPIHDAVLAVKELIELFHKLAGVKDKAADWIAEQVPAPIRKGWSARPGRNFGAQSPAFANLPPLPGVTSPLPTAGASPSVGAGASRPNVTNHIAMQVAVDATNMEGVEELTEAVLEEGFGKKLDDWVSQFSSRFLG